LSRVYGVDDLKIQSWMKHKWQR